MRRLVLQRARWHQDYIHKTCRSSPHHIRSFSSHPRRLDGNRRKTEPTKVRYYEQDTQESSNTRKFLGEENVDEDADPEEVKEKIDKLDEEIEELERGPFAPGSPFLKSLSEEDRARLLEALSRPELEKQSKDADVDTEGPTGVDDEAEEIEALDIEVPEKYLPYLEKLNLYLGKSKNGAQAARGYLWKYYVLSKESVPDLLQHIPWSVWRILWESQASLNPENTSRNAHIVTLGEDIRAVGRKLEPAQTLTYIQCLHMEDHRQQALELFEENTKTLGTDAAILEDFWELGVTVYADQGFAERAESLAEELLMVHESQRRHVLILVIVAWANQKTDYAMHRAWAVYLQWRVEAGERMSLKDYDTISSAFLSTSRGDLALAVFRDMMVTGQDANFDSTRALNRYVNLVDNAKLDQKTIKKDINKVSLEALAHFDKKFHNKFFFAMWMKRLIGNGEVDAAAMVVELMYERGVRPDARHLNGIISGWFRFGDRTSKEKAERMAWTMIRERIKFVKTRKAEQGTSQHMQTEKPPTNTEEDIRRAPRATTETFGVLLLSYTRRGMLDQTSQLLQSMAEAEIPPNTAFMNHLMRVDLHKWDIRMVWERYCDFKSTKPDADTFAILWHASELQQDHRKSTSWPGFPSVPSLFKEMVDHYNSLNAYRQRQFFEEDGRELYRQIITAVCHSHDIATIITAFNLLAKIFAQYPDEDTARSIILRIARFMPLSKEKSWRRQRRASENPHHKAQVAKIVAQLEDLIRRRNLVLESKGVIVEALSPERQKEEHLSVLTELLRLKFEDLKAKNTSIPRAVDEVAREMGFEGSLALYPLELGD